jgi:predicted transcriptional regulator
MRRKLESEIAQFRQQISVCQNEISLREKVLHDLDELEGRTTAGVSSTMQPVAISAKVGLTDAIRAIISRASTQLSAPEIRDQLLSSGFAPRSNFLVMIHSTLSRLEKAGEVEKNTSTGKWLAMHGLRTDSNEKQRLALVLPRSASKTENPQLTPVLPVPTERSTSTRADKLELIVRLRNEGKTNKEIAKVLGMDTHAFQCSVTTLIKRGLLKRREPGRRARNVLHAAGENL